MSKNKKLIFFSILILLTVNFAVFLPSMTGDFLWDDKTLISENPNLLSPDFLKKFLFSPFGSISGLDENSVQLEKSKQFYRPLTSLSYWIDYKIWNFNPGGFHLTNIILNMINVFLLFLILMTISQRIPVSFWGALLFSVFPFHFENVSWISGRTDLLAFLFASLSVLCFVNYSKKKNHLSLVLSVVFYFFSLLSKECGVLLILVFFFFLYFKERNFKKSIVSILPYLFSLVIWIILRNEALKILSFDYSGKTILDLLASIGFYFIRLIFPYHLSFTIDPYRVFDHGFYIVVGGLISIITLIALLLLFIKKTRYHKYFLFLISFYMLLFPSLVIIFSSHTASYMAWRFLYLPSAIFLFFLVYIIFNKIKNKYVCAFLVLLLFFSYTLEIYPKNKAFGKNEDGFWLSFKDINREDLLAKYNVGFTYLPLNEKKALEILNRVISQKEHHLNEIYTLKIYEDLAQYYTFEKEFEKAEKYFYMLQLKRDTQSQHFYFTYAYYLALKGKPEEGERIVEKMLSLFPENHKVLFHAGWFYMIINEYQKAEKLLTKDYRLFPNRETLEYLNKIKKEMQTEKDV